jgi:hypothetical protein
MNQNWHRQHVSFQHVNKLSEPTYIRLDKGVFILSNCTHVIVHAGTPTLYLIDDLEGTKELPQKKGTLSSLAMNGRHAKQSVWVLVQQYNTVVKEFRLQTEWVILFHCKRSTLIQ